MRKLRRAVAPLALVALFTLPAAGALADSSAPSVSTGPAVAVSNSGATLIGTVNPNGQQTQYAFQYGPTAGYGRETSLQPAGAGSATMAESASISGLNPGTTYHFRIIAISSAGTSVGSDSTFRTSGTAPAPAPSPTAATGSASNVGPNLATVNGSVNPRGRSTRYLVEYGQTSAYGFQTTSASAGSGNGSVAVHMALPDLQPGTTYHYRIVAYSSAGVGLGSDAQFTTPAGTSRVAILGRQAYLAPRGGYVGAVLGCFGKMRCTGRLKLTRGKTVYAQRNFNLAPESGGFFNVRLSRASQRALLRNYRGPVAIRLTVNTSTGQRLSVVLHMARWY